MAEDSNISIELPRDVVMDVERDLAARSFRHYVRMAFEHVEPEMEFRDNWHIKLICDTLRNLTDGTLTDEQQRVVNDLLINVPPGTMKSLLCCVLWPTWVWGPLKRPNTRWFFASYSDELTTRDSVKRRKLMQSEWYRKLWGDVFSLQNDANLKTRYMNDHGGEMIASSVGGSGLGEHPDFLVIDDPHKTKGADSEVERSTVTSWWRSTVMSRGRLRGSRRVVIMQRLNEDDLAGVLIADAKRMGKPFRHICLPMEFEPSHPFRCPEDPRTAPGELLWSNGFTPEMVAEIKGGMTQRVAAGQLQQRPSSAAGTMFKREYIRYFRRVKDKESGLDYYELQQPNGVKRRVLVSDCWRFITADTAMTENTQSDYTVRQVWDVEKIFNSEGKPVGGSMMLIDQWREQVETPVVEAEFRTSITRWTPLFIGLEAISDGLTIYQRMRNDALPVRRIKYGEKWNIPDKVTKATLAEIWMSQGKVYFGENADYIDDLETELLSFPHAKHDDQVDALSMAVHFANNRDMWVAPPKKPLPPDAIGRFLGHDKLLDPDYLAEAENSAFALDAERMAP